MYVIAIQKQKEEMGKPDRVQETRYDSMGTLAVAKEVMEKGVEENWLADEIDAATDTQ